MNWTGFLRKMSVILEQKANGLFSYPVKLQRKYYTKFSEPKDDIERSYDQYCCQMKLYRSPMLSIFLNIISLPLIIIYLWKPNSSILKGNADAVFFADGKSDSIIPNEVKEKYPLTWIVKEKFEALFKEDRLFFAKLFCRYPFSWHFLLKCLMKIRFYSYQIKTYHPRAIIVCNEYSFTSSLMTEYCARHRIIHINVMHGEKLLYMRDAFFRFDECYVWDKYYIDLFEQLRADKKQFKVAIPPSIRFSERNIKKIIDYTYYLGNEKGERLKYILTLMIELKKKGYRIAIRPHPRYSNVAEIRKLLNGISVEDCMQLSIEESVLRTRSVISAYSTVLNQAYHNGVNVIIDDVTSPKEFLKLKERKYIMLNKKHNLLSDVLKCNSII